MATDLKNIYFIKTAENGTYQDVTTLVDGVRILKIDGFFDKGEPVNIYTAQWIDGQDEDFMITTLDDNEQPVVIRKNTDLSVTFIVGQKYASAQIDVATQHDTFVNHLTNSDVWLKSLYADKEVHCVCLENYSPTLIKLQRGSKSYMMGTITLHTLDVPATIE